MNGQLVTVLFLTWLLFAYRDLWPLATFTLQPPDLTEGWLLWVKLVVLSVAGVGIPLFMPRQYIPVNPKVSKRITPLQPVLTSRKEPAAEPNAEQTASLFSLVLYTFLDPVIFKAYSVTHLSADQFPPLADYDYAKHLVKRSFKVRIQAATPQSGLSLNVTSIWTHSRPISRVLKSVIRSLV